MRKMIFALILLVSVIFALTACSFSNYSMTINDFSIAYGDPHIACCNITVTNTSPDNYTFMIEFNVYQNDTDELVDSELIYPFLMSGESRTYDVYFTSDYYDFYDTYVVASVVLELESYA